MAATVVTTAGDDDAAVCPITLAPFIDPVIAADGHTYERG